MMYQLHKTQQLYCDINVAWKFFSSPLNLSHITPPDMNFIVLTHLPDETIYEGMIIDYKVSPLMGIPIKWQTVIMQVKELNSFTDFQKRGPYKLWKHLHEFIPNERGVLMKDTVEYELPYGVIGKVAHSLIIYKKLQNIFDYRYQVLEKLFNTEKQKI